MRYSLHKQASASLKSGLDLKEIVKLPDNEDEDDWIAVHGKNERSRLLIKKVIQTIELSISCHCHIAFTF
jgi:DNA primase